METNNTQTSVVPQKKKNPLFKWILVVGIMVVTNLFLNYALDAFYPAPKDEDFCPNPQVREAVLTQEACVAKGGQWSEGQYPKEIIYRNAVETTPISAVEIKGYCNERFTCQKNFDEAQKIYNRNVFIVLVVAGTALLIGGMFASTIEAVALSFSFAGVLSLIIGTMRYWVSMDERLRVVVLGIALVALVWIGIKKFRE